MNDAFSVARGVQYLLRHQMKDGSWEEVRHTGTGFPRVFISATIVLPYFPLWALAMYRNLRTRGNAATKYGSTYSCPGVIRAIVEPPADVIRWRGATLSGSAVHPIAIFAATRWELQAFARARDGSRCDNRRSPLPYGQRGDRTYWLIPNRRRSVRPALLREGC